MCYTYTKYLKNNIILQIKVTQTLTKRQFVVIHTIFQNEIPAFDVQVTVNSEKFF